MIEWFCFSQRSSCRCSSLAALATWAASDSADHDVWRRMCVKEEDGHEWD